MKRITSNNNKISGEVVAMIFYLSVVKGYTTEGGYFYERDKSYYNNVLLSDEHLEDAIKRIAGLMNLTEEYIRENIRIEDAAEHEARAARSYKEFMAHHNWFAGITC